MREASKANMVSRTAQLAGFREAEAYRASIPPYPRHERPPFGNRHRVL